MALGQPRQLTFTLRNPGTKVLTYTASLPVEPYGVWRSDQADGPAASWVDPPADATTISLSDDGVSAPIGLGFAFPFFGQSYSALSIGANGLLSFAPLGSPTSSYAAGCLPLIETPDAALIPLRVDLDPSKPLARVSYARSAAGFLVSWEDVPLFDAPQESLSFQALLRPDGLISLRYKTVGALLPAESASAGLQNNLAEVQSLGCKTGLPVADGLTVELRPQAPTTAWLSVSQAEGGVAPAAQVGVPVEVRWTSVRLFPRRFSGVVELRSNDPNTPVARFTVRLDAAAAPHTVLLPHMYTR